MYGNPLRMALAALLGRFGGVLGVGSVWGTAICYRKSGLAARILMAHEVRVNQTRLIKSRGKFLSPARYKPDCYFM